MAVTERQYYKCRAEHNDGKMPLLLFKPPSASLHSAVEWPTNATHIVIPTCSPYPVLCWSEMWK